MTILLQTLSHPKVGGGIHVSARVVERTAAQLAMSVPGVGAPGTQVMGVGREADFDKRPRLQTHIDGGRAFLTIDCAVEYPRPIGVTAEKVRQVLTDRLTELTGVPVARVDVRVRRVVAHIDGTRSVV